MEAKRMRSVNYRGNHRRLAAMTSLVSMAVLAALSGGAFGASETAAGAEAAIEAAVPVPEAADTPPLTRTDIAPAGSALDIKSLTGRQLIDAPLAAGLSAGDAATAGMLRELIANRLARLIERKDERTAIEAFYRDRGFAPLWASADGPTARASAAIAALRGVEADGLDAADYPAPAFAASDDPGRRAENEIALTRSILTFTRHASSGRVNVSRVSAAISYEQKPADPAAVLAALASSAPVAELLDGYNPQQPGYKALKAKLAQERAKPAGAAVINTIIANMERWRWLPRDLGQTYVMVNIPDYSLAVIDNGRSAFTTRIVVGKPGAQATPVMSATMQYITVNPTWNVPPSIIRNEYLPALAQDPDALSRIGLKIEHTRNGELRVYQPPGERNALGRIRFNFPNRFLVYQHDTPDKGLFAHATRAYSHGCMRVQFPDRYAEVLLSLSQPQAGYTAERIRSLFGKDERNINLARPIPVHLTYQTAFVDADGHLQTRADVYGRDHAILALMRGEQVVAERPVKRADRNRDRPVYARLPARREAADDRYYDSFNGGYSGYAPVRQRRYYGGNGGGDGFFNFFFR
jgi:murein L,D-transpeptidase YcbB/YkuD